MLLFRVPIFQKPSEETSARTGSGPAAPQELGTLVDFCGFGDLRGLKV